MRRGSGEGVGRSEHRGGGGSAARFSGADGKGVREKVTGNGLRERGTGKLKLGSAPDMVVLRKLDDGLFFSMTLGFGPKTNPLKRPKTLPLNPYRYLPTDTPLQKHFTETPQAPDLDWALPRPPRHPWDLQVFPVGTCELALVPGPS